MRGILIKSSKVLPERYFVSSRGVCALRVLCLSCALCVLCEGGCVVCLICIGPVICVAYPVRNIYDKYIEYILYIY